MERQSMERQGIEQQGTERQEIERQSMEQQRSDCCGRQDSRGDAAEAPRLPSDPCSLIERHARQLGYDLVGFTALTLDRRDRSNLARFAAKGLYGEMGWLRRHIQLRRNPARIMPGAKSAVVLASYYRDRQAEELLRQAPIRIARYALGRDYHRILRKRGSRLLRQLQRELPDLQGRIAVDSAPLPEKILGRMAGIGWQGKNTNLIHPQLGSYFFVSILLLNLPLPSQPEIPDHCGSCNLCIEACPTEALKPYQIDARRCISYLTIEHKSKIPSAYQGRLSGWAFGCDICQEVCPYNRNRRTRDMDTREEAFRLGAALKKFLIESEYSGYAECDPECDPEYAGSSKDWQRDWERLSRGAPLRRINKEKFRSNLRLALSSRQLRR